MIYITQKTLWPLMLYPDLSAIHNVRKNRRLFFANGHHVTFTKKITTYTIINLWTTGCSLKRQALRKRIFVEVIVWGKNIERYPIRYTSKISGDLALMTLCEWLLSGRSLSVYDNNKNCLMIV